MKSNHRRLLPSVMALFLALPGLALADRYGHQQHYSGYLQGYGYNDHPKKHHKHRSKQGHHQKKQRGNRKGRRGNHGYSEKQVTHYHNRDNGNEKLLIGLLVGGIAGYVINDARHGSVDTQSTYYPPPQPVPSPVSGHPHNNRSCLQQREYQTTVVVGGRSVPAYGTACLQPDGSWRFEPAAPGF